MEPLKFGTLYGRYAPEVLRFALYLTGSRADAEDITSEVFVRVWAGSGEARSDTRSLVDACLKANPQVKKMRPNDFHLPSDRPPLPPDAEAAAFARTRELLYGRRWLRGLRSVSIVITALALGLIIPDTSRDVSPRGFIATVIVAAISWTSYVVLLRHYRARS